MYLYTSNNELSFFGLFGQTNKLNIADVAEFAKAVSDTSYVVLDVRTPASISGTYFSIDVQELGTGLLFFVMLAGLWQLLWHTEISCVKDLLKPESLRLFVSGMMDLSHSKSHLSGYELGIFFSIFLMLQFWNLFNAKYYRTDRSLLIDIADLFRCPQKVKESYSSGFIWISLVIVLGQILIVSFA